MCSGTNGLTRQSPILAIAFICLRLNAGISHIKPLLVSHPVREMNDVGAPRASRRHRGVVVGFGWFGAGLVVACCLRLGAI
tara:strand:+ start:386 stop:628 length:243 start_codon:yes stop_codon:yes gene_type:complete